MNLAITTALLVGVWSVVDTGAQTWAALSGTTANSGNAFSAGTVALTDNDGGSTPMFTFTNQRPGVVANSCIKVTYSGSLSATVKLYASVSGTLAPYLNVTVTRGTDLTPSFSSCSTFTPDALDYNGLGNGVLFSGTLSSFPTSYAAAISDPSASWTSGSTASYRFSVQIADINAAQGLSASSAFTWEAPVDPQRVGDPHDGTHDPRAAGQGRGLVRGGIPRRPAGPRVARGRRPVPGHVRAVREHGADPRRRRPGGREGRAPRPAAGR